MACEDHECDQCEICQSGQCCGEMVYDKPLPAQGSWPDEPHAPLGIMVLTDDDKVICHVCGKAYKALWKHIQTHGLQADTYRATFGLRVTEPLCTPSLAEARQGAKRPDKRDSVPPQLTREQRQEIHRRREERIGSALAWSRRNPEHQRWAARQLDHTSEEYRTAVRKARRKEDAGHECPSCGALVCTWTGRASGISTQRTLCGEPECIKIARSKAAVIANRKRYETL